MDNSNIKTDQELAALALADKKCFAELVLRYEPKLRRYLGRITSFSREEIDDCLQDVFIKTYKNLNGYDKSFSFSSWIYRITHNQAISLFRLSSAHPANLTLDNEDSLRLADELDLSKDLDNVLLGEKIQATLEKLKPAHREILTLKFLEEKTYEEISDVLRKPMGTVATLIYKAKNEFKKYWI